MNFNFSCSVDEGKLNLTVLVFRGLAWFVPSTKFYKLS